MKVNMRLSGVWLHKSAAVSSIRTRLRTRTGHLQQKYSIVRTVLASDHAQCVELLNKLLYISTVAKLHSNVNSKQNDILSLSQ